MTSQSFTFFAIIPTRSICLTYSNNPEAECVRTALQFREKNENSPSCVHVLHKTLNMVISRCSCPQNEREMYQNV